MPHSNVLTRRQASRALLVGATAVCLPSVGLPRVENEAFRLRYILPSSMYGTMPLENILPEVEGTGAEALDVWPHPHANQREQIEQMGHEAFRRILDRHDVRLGMTTRYDLGPFGLQDEIRLVHKFGGRLIVCGAKPVGGDTLREQVRAFVRKMTPHVALAEEHGVTIGIENHGRSLLESPDSLRYFAEFAKWPSLGVALAPYHLPQDEQLLATLIEELGEKLVHFYAWEHGDGAVEKLSKDREMKQMPGFGSLDFAPLLSSLRKIDYAHWTEIFMHPVPRGIPIVDTKEGVTTAINRSRSYLEGCLANE